MQSHNILQYLDILEYKFELDDFQKKSFNHIVNNDNLLVTAHTGSGKTVVAELAILKNLLCDKKIIYISPIKSLSNEKYKDFKMKFEKNKKLDFMSIEVGLITGDLKINPNANILIMTTEILRIILYSIDTKHSINDNKHILNEINMDNVGCVIIDEVHYINNTQRGTVWEETIMLLHRDIQLIMLSATIRNAEFFADWITTIKSKNTYVLSTMKRVVPLKNYIYIDDTLFLIMDENNKYYDSNVDLACEYMYEYKKLMKKNISYINVIQKMVTYVMKNNLYPCTFFSFSRFNCEKLASSINISLIDDNERSNIESIFKHYMHTYHEIFLKIKNYQVIYNLLLKGIAFHHSGMLPILKEIVEIIFEKGFIKILFATETFAVGINKPIRTVIFLELEKFTDSKKRYLQTDEYKQMMGRAGRRGIDKEGTIIILPNPNEDFFEKKTLKDILQGDMPEIKSKLTINPSLILKLLYFYNEQKNILNDEQNNEYNDEYNRVNKFIEMSLTQKENDINIIQVIHEKNECEKKMNNIVVDKTKLEEYRKFIEKQQIFRNLNISITPKQKKENIKNKQKFGDTTLYELYINEEQKLIKYNNIIDNSSEYINNIHYILYFLKKTNYLDYNHNDNNIDILKNTKLTINGIIAAHINDCNCFVLTEMYTQKMFNGLTCSEIVGLLAIFIDDKQDYNLSDIENVIVKNCIKKVISIIDNFNIIENEIHYFNNDWNIYFGFVDIAYCWTNNGNYFDICKKGNIYEGNFVRNILKINNIVDNLIRICYIYNDMSILNILEQINSLIIKDIVLNVSLYV